MPSEKSMWQSLKPSFDKAGFHAFRVENPVFPGTPDVSYACKSCAGWMELKYLSRWPVRGGIVRVDHYTNQQRSFAVKHINAGGDCWLMLKAGNDWLLMWGYTAARRLGKATPRELFDIAEASWHQTPTAQQLKEALCN